MTDFKQFVFVIVMYFILVGIVSYFDYKREKQNCLDYYQKGYVDAVKDFYKGKTKVDLIENEDGTKEWKIIEELTPEK